MLGGHLGRVVLAAGLVVGGAGACGGDGGSGSTSAADLDLMVVDGASVVAVAPIEGDVTYRGKPVTNHGWRAVATIEGDPRAAFDRYVASAEEAGLAMEKPQCDAGGCQTYGIRGNIRQLQESDTLMIRVRTEAPAAAYLDYRRTTGDERTIAAVAASTAGRGGALATPIDGAFEAPLTLPAGVEAVSPVVAQPGCGNGFAVALSSPNDLERVARDVAAMSETATHPDKVTSTSRHDSGVDVIEVHAAQAGGVDLDTFLVAADGGTTGVLRACND